MRPMTRMKLHAAAASAVLAAGLTGDDMLSAAKNACDSGAIARAKPPAPARTKADFDRMAAAQAKRDRKAAKRKQWTEKLGETCMDGGTCHHQCTTKCFRRECCVPLALALDAGLRMKQWRYSEVSK